MKKSNSYGFDSRDSYMVYRNGVIEIETQPTLERAEKAVKILNDHEVRNNREPNYSFQERVKS